MYKVELDGVYNRQSYKHYCVDVILYKYFKEVSTFH